MPTPTDPPSPAPAILEALGYAVLLRGVDGAVRLGGTAPAWLRALWPAACEPGAALSLPDVSPFLENFLIDAEECWSADHAQRAQSGPWIESNRSGGEVQLNATAMTVDGQRVLLIEKLGDAFEEKKSTLQKARETVIAYQRLNAEMQKKEILLHCLAEDLTASLSNIITAVRLLELEPDPTKSRQLLSLAARATDEQSDLIHRILDVFEPELAVLYERAGEADLVEFVQRAIEIVEPQFNEKRVTISNVVPVAGLAKVAASTGAMQRVVANLLENALLQTPTGQQIAVEAADDGEYLLLRVRDAAPALSEEVRARLFAKLAIDHERPTAAVLRLHFCRIAIENCGGEIGCDSPSETGNVFWIRLPRIAAPSA